MTERPLSQTIPSSQTTPPDAVGSAARTPGVDAGAQQAPSAFDERMHPAWWWWLVALAMWLSVWVAVWAYLDATWAFAITLAIAVFTGSWIAQFGLHVRADAAGLRAGRNLIEWQWLSGARPLDARATAARTSDSDHHADFLATRPFVPTAVVFAVDDPADPHPNWVVATRRPTELAAVASQYIRAAREVR